MSEDRYHPRHVTQLYGHESAEKQFLNYLHSERMPHAWLITGSRGIGKATLAYQMARYLLSGGAPASEQEESLFGDALPQMVPERLTINLDHPAIARIIEGTHTDLLVLQPDIEEGKTEITVDAVRKVSHLLGHSASESDWRIIIVDSADELNRNAANALLKMLEEPPKNSLWLLVSHAPGRLLPTIRSRCCALNLKPLSIPQVETILDHVLTRVSEQEKHMAARLSDGAPGMAVRLCSKESLTLYHDIMEVLNSMPEGDILRMDTLATHVAAKKNIALWPLFIYMFHYLIMGAVRHKASCANDHLSAEEDATIARLAEHYSVDQLTQLWEKSGRMFAEADWINMDRRLVVTQLFNMMRHPALMETAGI